MEWGSDTKEPLLKARIQVWSGVPQSDQADDQNYPAMAGAWLSRCCLLQKCEGLRSIPSTSIKSQLWTHGLTIPLLCRGGRRIPGTQWPASLACLGSLLSRQSHYS